MRSEEEIREKLKMCNYRYRLFGFAPEDAGMVAALEWVLEGDWMKCKLCGKTELNPFNNNMATHMTFDSMHWIKEHTTELDAYLKEHIMEAFGSENDLYPTYYEFYPFGDMLTCHLEIYGIVHDFIEKNVEPNPKGGDNHE